MHNLISIKVRQLRKWRVLKWVNRQRYVYSLGPPLKKLPQGTPSYATRCPIARALSSTGSPYIARACWGKVELGVDRRLRAHTRNQYVRMPKYVTKFIKEFDHFLYPELIAYE